MSYLVKINIYSNNQRKIRVIFYLYILVTAFSFSFSENTPCIAITNGFDGKYEPSRMCAISELRIWFTNTTFDNITASKWFPSNATEYHNNTINVDFKEKILQDIKDIYINENYQVFVFNWSSAIAWSINESRFNNFDNNVYLHDIDNEPYLNYTETVFSSLLLSNCSFLNFSYNSTVLDNYENAMEANDFTIANSFVPEAANEEEYLANKPIPRVYAINKSTIRLAKSLESLWYIDHVDIFYDYDGTRDTYGLTNSSILDILFDNWEITMFLAITVIIISLIFLKIRK